VRGINLTERQNRIIEIVKEEQPITGERIASRLSLTRAALRPDLMVLTMAGILDARPKVGYFHTGRTATDIVAQLVRNVKVKDIKSQPVVVNVDSSVYDSIVTIFLEDVGTIFVESEGFLIGVASRKDFIKHAMGTTDLDKMPVSIVMTRMPNIVTLEDNDTLADAVVKMVEHQIDCTPVVEKCTDGKGGYRYRITGRVSKTTVIRAIYDMLKG
jgi:CBS domain-containing protein